MNKLNKTYLGDSVYVSDDGFMFRLTTENGGPHSNEIFLDSEVLDSLIVYVGKQRNLDIRVTKISKVDPNEEETCRYT